MEPSTFRYAITYQKIPLTASQKFSHFFIVIAFAAFTIMCIYTMLTSNDKDTFERSLTVFIITIILTLITYYIQKRRLRFIVLETILNKYQLDEVIAYVASRQNWKEAARGENYYVATSYGGFLSGSWGEYITILFHNNTVYFNSICNPNKKPSVTAWGRNWEHAKIFKKAVVLLEEHTKRQEKQL